MRQRGARPSPRHRLAGAAPHRILGTTPAQFLWKPAQLSMWLNDVDGDCVTAEEAFAKACYSPEIFITDDTVKDWATKNDVLNGTDLITVLDMMQTGGFQQNDKTYNDGVIISVNWTDTEILQNAIVQGPVKIGIAANQLEDAIGTDDPPPSGWLATGFMPDSLQDHCTSLCGFGPIEWLLGQLGVKSQRHDLGYAMFTWDSIGVIDIPSLLAITGEAWLRNPTTIITGI